MRVVRWSMAVLAAAAVFMSGFAPALADTKSFNDARGDVSAYRIDIKSTTVTHTKSAITITTKLTGENATGSAETYLDTDPKRPGPEWVAGSGRYSEYYFSPMRKWKEVNDPRWSGEGRCAADFSLNGGNFNTERWTIKKRPGCLGTPSKVRVDVKQATDGYMAPDGSVSEYWNGTTLTDYLVGDRKFTPRVKVGKTKRIRDKKDRINHWSDIRKVTVSHSSTQTRVRAAHSTRPRSSYVSAPLWVYLDTTSARKGPEFAVQIDSAGAPAYFYPVRKWQLGESLGGCVSSVTSSFDGKSFTEATVAASCLGSPSRVRVAVQREDLSATVPRPISDWYKGTRKFTSWVSR